MASDTTANLAAQLQAGDCTLVARAAGQLAANGARLPAAQLLRARSCIADAYGVGLRMGLTRDYFRLVETDAEQDAEARRLLQQVHDPAVHDEVFWSLIDRGEAALPLLLELARDQDDGMRWRAYDAIRLTGGEEALPLFVAGLRDQSFAIRWISTNALVDMGEDAVEPVLYALVHGEPTAAFHAAARRVLLRLRGTTGAVDLASLVAALARSTTIYESQSLALMALLRRSASADERASEAGRGPR